MATTKAFELAQLSALTTVDASGNVTTNTSQIANASGDLTLDSAADIILNVDGGDLRLYDDTVQFGRIANDSTDLVIEAYAADRSLLFKGLDDTTPITALTLDMSASGAATFNDQVTIGGNLIHAGNLTIDAGGDITLNADGADVILADGAVEFGRFKRDSGHLVIKSETIDKSVIIKGTTTSNAVVTALTFDMANSGRATFNENVVIQGDLTVEGSQVTLNTTALDVEDKNITLNYHASNDTSASADGAGITIQDAVDASNDASILWDASDDQFDFSHGVNVSGNSNISGNLDIAASTTETRSLQIGHGRTGDGISLIDLVGDATYSDYGFRIQRAGTSSGKSSLLHKGTGNLEIRAIDASAIRFKTTDTDRMFIMSGGDISFYEDNSGSPQVGMHWDYADGRLGIGTTAPDSLLDVKIAEDTLANVLANEIYAATFLSTTSGNAGHATAIMLSGSSGTNRGVAIAAEAQSTGNDHDMIFATSASGSTPAEHVRITSDGNVGIGNSNPQHRIHFGVQNGYYTSIGSGNRTPGGTQPWLGVFDNSNIASATHGWGFYDSNADGSFQIWNKNNSTTGYNTFTIKRGGKVGIGTDDPQSHIEIEQTGSTVFDATDTSGQAGDGATLAIQNLSDTNDTFSQILFRNRNASKAVSRIASITNGTGTDLVFVVENQGSAPSEVMRINKLGRLGIGVNPTQRPLEIQDNVPFIKLIDNNLSTRYAEVGGENGNIELNVDPGQAEPNSSFSVSIDGSQVMGALPGGAVTVEQERSPVAPTLSLDFTNTTELDSRIMFHRDSMASYYGPDGYIHYAKANQPRFEYDATTHDSKGLLIEENSENIFINSNNPETWSLVSAAGSKNHVPCAVKSPDGTMNASLLYTTGTDPYYYQNNLSLAGYYTFSFWIKAFGNTIGKHYTVRGSNISTTFSDAHNLPSEWTKIEKHFYTTSVTTAYVGIEAPDNSPALLDEISIWGAQLEPKTFTTSYMPSKDQFVSRASPATHYNENGVLVTAPINSPRYGYEYDGKDWVKTGLIREKASTNLLYQSNGLTDTFGDYLGMEAKWTKTAHSTDVTAPDGSRFTTKGETSSTGNHWFWMVSPGSRTNGVRYTHSVWIRTAAGTTGNISFNCYPQSGNVTVTATDQWQRIQVSYTHDSNLGNAYIGFVSPESNRTFYFWGWQAEEGYRATSYISGKDGVMPTRAADIVNSERGVREQDVAQMFDLSWYNPKESTIYGEGTSYTKNLDTGSNPCLWGITDGTSNNRYLLRRYDNDVTNDPTYAGFTFRMVQPGHNNDYFPLVNTLPEWDDDSIHKMSLGIKVDSQIAAADGIDAQMSSITMPEYTTADRVEIGDAGSSDPWNGHIRKLVYYPKQLTLAQQKALTEIV